MNTNYLNISSHTPLTSHLTNTWYLQVEPASPSRARRSKEIKSGKKLTIHFSQMLEAYLELQQHQWCITTAGGKETFWLLVGVQHMTALPALKDNSLHGGTKEGGTPRNPVSAVFSHCMWLHPGAPCHWQLRRLKASEHQGKKGEDGTSWSSVVMVWERPLVQVAPCCQKRAEAEPIVLRTTSFFQSSRSICVQPPPQRRPAQETPACAGDSWFHGFFPSPFLKAISFSGSSTQEAAIEYPRDLMTNSDTSWSLQLFGTRPSAC